MLNVECTGDFIRISEDRCDEATLYKIDEIVDNYPLRLIDWELRSANGKKLVSRPKLERVGDNFVLSDSAEVLDVINEYLNKNIRIELNLLFMRLSNYDME